VLASRELRRPYGDGNRIVTSDLPIERSNALRDSLIE
jgi:hypothetical protein